MYAIKKIVSIHIISAGCYFEDHFLGLVEPNLQPLLEETSSYLLSYWSYQLATGGAGGRHGRCIVIKKAYCTGKKVQIGRISEEATAPLHFELRGWLMDLCCSQKPDLS